MKWRRGANGPILRPILVVVVGGLATVKLFVILAFAAFLTWSATAYPQSLWQGTAYGMSISDVQKTVPAARPTSDKPNTLHGGAVERLRIDEFLLVGKSFSVLFFFLEEKLVQVTLRLNGEFSYHTAMLVFDSLMDALRVRYGVELSKRISNDAHMPSANAEWQSGKTNINLFAMTVGRNPALLNLNYQTRIGKEADKL
jgi:hypothetical protein